MLTVSGVTGTVPTLPTANVTGGVLLEDTDYWVHSVTPATNLDYGNHTGKVQLKETLSGSTAISFTGNSPFGSTATFGSTGTTVGHILLYSANTAETGKDFYDKDWLFCAVSFLLLDFFFSS